ncbi:hypothetical protein GGI23_002437, partial [Coemansia sp. RSA 2559]
FEVDEEADEFKQLHAMPTQRRAQQKQQQQQQQQTKRRAADDSSDDDVDIRTSGSAALGNDSESDGEFFE